MVQKKVDKDIVVQMRKEGMSCVQIAERFGVGKNRIYVILAKDRKKKSEGNYSECKYNIGINCDSKSCEKCGWSPEVSKRRSIEYKTRNGMLREVMRFE